MGLHQYALSANIVQLDDCCYIEVRAALSVFVVRLGVNALSEIEDTRPQDVPSRSLPGSVERRLQYAFRAANNLQLFHPEDNDNVTGSQSRKDLRISPDGCIRQTLK